jgi:hypothetical protein
VEQRDFRLPCRISSPKWVTGSSLWLVAGEIKNVRQVCGNVTLTAAENSRFANIDHH